MFENRKNLDRYLSHQFDLLNMLLEDLHGWKEELRETMKEFKKDSISVIRFHSLKQDLRFLKQDVAEAQRLVDEKRNHIKKVIDDHIVKFPDLLSESMKSNRHVSHLGGLGSGDGLSTSLNQDMNPPKISGGGFEGTADSNFSKKIGQLRVHIDDNWDLMFPENENIETLRSKKDTIRGKYKMRESKKSKKTLIDLFDDKYFEEKEDATHFKKFDNNKNLPEEFQEKLIKDEIIDNLNSNRKFDNPTQKASQLSVKQLSKKIKKEVFNQIKEEAKKNGMKLILKEDSSCTECGMIYESCMCEEKPIDEFSALGNGGVAGYQTQLTTPGNMKKHMKKMLPAGYKYR